MKKILLVLIVLSFPFVMQSQNITPVGVTYFSDSVYNGSVKIHQSSSLQNFVETAVGLNKKHRGFPGYRVKIFAQNKQNSRAQANEIRLQYDNEEHAAYVVYAEPNFEVHVGDFMTRFEALVLLQKLIGTFPEAYVIKTTITYPKH